jgi:hypothetical protein
MNMAEEDRERLVRVETLLEQVLGQTTKTNGRVSSLEKFKSRAVTASVTCLVLVVVHQLGLVGAIVEFAGG